VTDYDAATYGDRIAEVYDEWFGVPLDTEDTVGFLSDLAGPGPVLELGIGTGRIALPLVQRGHEVHGIDASEAMVEKLRSKDGGESITVTIGDFAGLDVEGKFSLVYVVFNTFFALLSQEDQVRCFSNVARRLQEGGVFLIEAFVPDMTRWHQDQRVEARRLGEDNVVLDAAKHNPVEQRVASNHLVISETGVKMYPVRLRYAWPSELDLMARLAGLRLRERWGGWRREPFTASSVKHVSVYERYRRVSYNWLTAEG
jgi:SAM-dependent methyltransferase